VRGDAQKLRQIFVNLIGNAVKFTSEAGRVEVSATIRSDGGSTITIRDNGIGMDEEELKVALAPFGQVDGKRTRWREGTGLGLPIAKSLVEMHGGQLQITSAKSQGTEVTVSFPSADFVAYMQHRNALSARSA
jgi:two-component system cell cycle sensor histidine kinase PleC